MKDWIKEQPLLAGALIGALLCAMGLVFWGGSLRDGNARLARQLSRDVSVWNGLTTRTPSPTEANVAAATLYLSDLQNQSRRLSQGLAAQGSWAPVPEFRGGEDLYFELVGMIERQRSAYAEAGVELVGNEQFGYGQIVRAQQVVLPGEDPLVSAKWIQRVHRQRQAIEASLSALLAANPTALLAVDRAPVDLDAPTEIGRNEDFFLVDPAVTAAVAGTIETYGLRLRFKGKTEVLRTFLSELASSRRPLVVRSVEVGPASGQDSARPAPGRSNSPFARLSNRREPDSVESASIPIVADNDSIFTVVLEGFAVVESTPAEETADAEGAE